MLIKGGAVLRPALETSQISSDSFSGEPRMGEEPAGRLLPVIRPRQGGSTCPAAPQQAALTHTHPETPVPVPLDLRSSPAYLTYLFSPLPKHPPPGLLPVPAPLVGEGDVSFAGRPVSQGGAYAPLFFL